MKRILLYYVFLTFTLQAFSQDSDKIKDKIIRDKYKTILELSFSEESNNDTTTNRWPMYINGLEGLNNFIEKNIKYPESASRNGIKGIVIFDYVITSKGKITQIRIMESPNELLSAEVIRVMKLTGPWIPGIYNSEYKPMRMSKSFEFK